jgi:hypothetical protein
VRPRPVRTSADQDRPGTPADGRDRLSELARHRPDAAFALDRFGDDRRGAIGDRCFERGDVAWCDERDRSQQRLERRAVVLIPGDGERAHRASRETALDGHEPGARIDALVNQQRRANFRQLDRFSVAVEKNTRARPEHVSRAATFHQRVV